MLTSRGAGRKKPFASTLSALPWQSCGACVCNTPCHCCGKPIAPDNVTEIAEQTGFQTAHSLCRSFRQHFGITPGSYRISTSGGTLPDHRP
ncbi:AraC family transcriptional regulator [Novipirellula artificiosorum]|uniref:AraC family transcriptional regulator n=1 Tax=Novipirellula artificiosorum TaxID=2528016 RepID=UPI0011B6F792